jgi:hypothetical protein
VAFVALSEEAEYAYAWLFASVVTRALRRLKAAASAVNEMSWLGFKPISSGSRWQRRQSEVTGAELLVSVKGYKELACVTDDIGD